MTLGEIAAAVDGELTAASPDTVVSQVSTDSRLVAEGSLFVAIAGTRADGHDFARSAVGSGALAVLGTRPTGVPTVVVADVLHALGRLARHHIGKTPGVTVVAVTGSVGKTTTKDMTADILAPHGATVWPPGSFNNELGLPLTVLQTDESTRFLVLEMGARGRGHISYLCSIAPPALGVELGVGTAHVGEFGGQPEIAASKAELIEALPSHGTAVLNRDDPLVVEMASRTAARILWFSQTRDADVTAVDIGRDRLDRAAFRLTTPQGSARVQLKYVGAPAITNALAAATVGAGVGIGADDIAAALSSAEPRSRWRMEVTERADGLIVINDAYNASPESMRAALRSLKHIAGDRRCWAVLGEMRELGESSDAEHAAIGRLAARLDVQRLVVIGEAARPMYEAAGPKGPWGRESMHVADAEEALRRLRAGLRSDDVVLVKASRAVGLDVVAAGLLGEALT